MCMLVNLGQLNFIILMTFLTTAWLKKITFPVEDNNFFDIPTKYPHTYFNSRLKGF